MNSLKELLSNLLSQIEISTERRNPENDTNWGMGFGVLISVEEARELVDVLDRELAQASRPERPAPDPTARPFPEPQDFTLVPITEKQAVGIAFDMYDSGYNVRIFRPDGGFDIELNHDKPFKP